MGNLVDIDKNPGQGIIPLPQPSSVNKIIQENPPATGAPVVEKFPKEADKYRLSDYEYFNHLLMGEHFEAFNIRVDNNIYGQHYGRLRYVAANFRGLISKV